jgi:hypothetical protein
MAFTYSKLAETTVGAGGTSAITFNNIPQNYTDLVVKYSLRTSRSDTISALRLTFNESATSYSNRMIEGNGATAASYTGGSTFIDLGYAPAATATASTFNNHELYISNYASSNNKSLSIDAVQENNTTTAYANLIAGLWSNSAAINSIKVVPSTAVNFVQYSTATLYGIRVEI